MGTNKKNNNSKLNKINTNPINDAPFPAYEGDEPYIFISYSHDDSDLVFPEIERFHNDGYNIWYDEGITSVEGYASAYGFYINHNFINLKKDDDKIKEKLDI
ncbi:hypothetical protein, partial [Methanobrevibacter sp.]|uniref:hypothetical protein n=1 Tax=Methanobrevibacter sp. TaxID=66852 RepID=UPI0026E09945